LNEAPSKHSPPAAATTSPAERLLLATFDSAAEGILVRDGSGRVILVNPSAQRILGLTHQEISTGEFKDPAWRMVREDGTALTSDEFPAISTLKTGQLLTDVVLSVHSSDRDPVWISVTTRPLRLPGDNTMRGVVMSIFDLTQRVRAEQALLDQQQGLLKKRDEFVATVSHELRTPLTSIIGYIDLMLESQNLARNDLRALETMQIDAQRLAAIVEDLLEVSRLESGIAELNGDMLELSTIAQAVTESFAPLFRGKHQTFHLEVPDGVRLWADRKRLIQILTNLLANAHHYTPADGTITLRATSERDFVRISVSDTGIGMSQSELARLFTKFYRAGKRTGGGSGLGLAITKALVELHRGRIEVSSVPGEGSVFSVLMPAHAPVIQTAGLSLDRLPRP
jgi:signal transduction histidine kinase